MCWACFKEYADAPVVNERVVAAYRLLAEADGTTNGRRAWHWGAADSSRLLHVIVADTNLDDRWFGLDGAENAGRVTDDADGGRHGEPDGAVPPGRYGVEHADWWETQRRLRGVPDGLSARVDRRRVNRLKALGNAIVPQVAYEIIRLME